MALAHEPMTAPFASRSTAPMRAGPAPRSAAGPAEDRTGRRVLVLAPTGRDAELACSVLGRAGVDCVRCESLEEVCERASAGAGAVLLSEEAIVRGSLAALVAWLAEQPAWSDFPILLLAITGADSWAVARAMTALGNVTVLERPLRIAALVSAVRTALRARERQYETREHLLELERSRRIELAGRVELEALMHAAPTAIWVAHDPDCRRITGNPAAARMLRVPRGSNMSASAPEGEAALAVEIRRDGTPLAPHELPMQVAARTGLSVPHQELELRFPDGTSNWAYGNAVPLFDVKGQVRGVVSTFVDITERKLAEQALREADRRKDEFLATLAHELRNPLAPIVSSLHILQLTGRQDPTAARVLAMMQRQVSHIVRLVDDLMEVSRITRGKIQLVRERVDLASVVRSALDTSRPWIEAGGHELVVDMPDEPLPLLGDPIRLAQVLANLLNNAAKYTPGGGHIRLAARRDSDWAVIEVTDDGRGIPPHMLSRVFDLFTQVAEGTDRGQQGLGIGLTLVRSLVDMHGGTVEAASDGPGRGSRFVVRLPLSETPHPSETNGREGGVKGVKLLHRILVVDDNRDAADTLAVLLELLGAQVRVVYGGSEALEAVRTFDPTVVLLDIGMPGLDGHEVARRIREQPQHAGAALIALTGWGQEEDRKRSELAGFDHHLIKPVDVEALQGLLESLERGSAPDRGD
jgi:signal transduction histidine kinase/CheY-like chemotaxis protein